MEEPGPETYRSGDAERKGLAGNEMPKITIKKGGGMLTYEAAFDLIPFSIYVVDTKTYELVFVNRTFEKLRGYPTGKKCWEAVYGNSSKCLFCKIDSLLNENGEPNSQSIAFENFDEPTDCWNQVQEQAIFWPDGRVVKYSILIDISNVKASQNRLAEVHAELSLSHAELLKAHGELKATQLKLERARHAAELGRVVAALAHRLGTPVGNVIGAGSLVGDAARRVRKVLSEGRLQKAELGEFLDTIAQASGIVIESGHRAAELVETFRNLATDVGGDPESVSVNNVFKDLKAVVGESAPEGVTLSFEAAARLSVLCHQNLLLSVLAELVGNAFRHAFPGGRAGQVTITAYAAGDDEVALVVADNGIGISSEHVERVFQPFYTNGRIGGDAGLGLAIVHNAVVGPLAGRISLDCCHGAGTTLTLTLPRASGGI